MLDARRASATIVNAIELKTGPTSTKFEIVLSCGCRFWEYHVTTPNLGETVYCYARHGKDPATLPPRMLG